jgi:hypothetical protein
LVLGIVLSLCAEPMRLKKVFKGALCYAIFAPELVRSQVAALYPPIDRSAGHLQPFGYFRQGQVTSAWLR